LSQPDGTYRFEPLPRIAQISVLQGLVAGDFGRGGHADIFAVQNSFAPIRADMRIDAASASCCAATDAGTSSRRRPRRAAWCARDAKALAVADIDRDGWPDFP